MFSRTPAAPQVHLHWVRETPSRVLESPVSTTLRTLDALPPCARTAVRAAGGESIELHLPPYRASVAPSLSAWSAGLEFRQDAAGRLVAAHRDDPAPLATMAAHQAAVLALRAISGDATPLTIVAESPFSGLLRRPLALRHRCLPGGGLAAAPPERTQPYYAVYRAISKAAQRSIREAVPPAHLTSLEQFEDRLHVLPLLTWSAAHPALGRYVGDLGIDIFLPAAVDRAFRDLPVRLEERLSEVAAVLGRHRSSPFLRACYHPAGAARIAARCRSRSRYLNLLFMNEFRVISAFTRFCARIPAWRQAADGNPAAAYRQIRRSWEDVEVHIRRFYQRRRHPQIGSILLLESVRVLEAVD